MFDEDQEPPNPSWTAVPRKWSAQSLKHLAKLREFTASMRTLGLSLLRRFLPNESQHLFALTIAVGVVCGLVAVAFHLAIRAGEHLLIERAMHAEGSSWMFWTILTPTLGALFCGAALAWIVPGARGSGIPQVKQAFAVEGGRVKFRDAIGKFFIGAVQIGSGASLGREGPTVQICAGATSLLARATSLPPRQMRRLTPVGVAAGIAAAFNAPIAAVTFTIEEIVGKLDQTVLSGVIVAAALAAVIERGILGAHPVIAVEQSYGLDHASSLVLYVVLGIAAAFVAMAFTDGLLKLRLLFRGMRFVPTWMQPAVGGLVTGVLAVIMLRFYGTSGVTGGGYETLGHALAGQLGLQVLVALCVVKLVATLFSYSSGGAGGIFAPALFVGAMLGGAVGHLDVLLLGHTSRQLGAFALVGMGAVFAGVIRAPITSVLIIFEMTGSYGLVLPLMVANMISYVIARRFRPLPIYEALLEQDGIVLPHATPAVHPLEQLQVADAMEGAVVSLKAEQTIAEGKALVEGRTFARVPVVDGAGVAVGVVSVAQLRAAADDTALVSTLLKPGSSIQRDAPLLRAVVKMNDLQTRQLLVLDAEAKLVGILAMSDIVRAHARAAPKGTPAVVPHHSSSQPELTARALMVRPTMVTGNERISELVQQEPSAQAFVIHEPGQRYALLLPEELQSFGKDDELKKMLIAADLARPVRSVTQRADVAAMLQAMQDTEAVVVASDSGVPIGVVTKLALARGFLDWYASLQTSLQPGGNPGDEPN